MLVARRAAGPGAALRRTLLAALAVVATTIAVPRQALAAGTADLTPGGDAACPVYSPDGSHIAYSSYTAGAADRELVIMEADGTNPVTIPDSVGYGCDATFSADGARVAFTARPFEDPGYALDVDLFVAQADGSSTTNLDLRGTVGATGIERPSWSPLGDTLVFDAQIPPDTTSNIHEIGADGTGLVALTADEVPSTWPAYSPDGTKIAFASRRSGCTAPTLHVMDADGGGVAEVTTCPTRFPAGAPLVWSPDGSSIAFPARVTAARAQAYVAKADGSGVTKISTFPSGEAFPFAWAPDSSLVYLTRTASSSNDANLYSGLPGSVSTNALTTNPASDVGGDVTPDGTTMTFVSDRLCTPDVWIAPTSGDTDTSDCPDTTAPTVSFVAPADGALYTIGQTVLADYSCADEPGGSGVASCVGDVPVGDPVDTSTEGPATFTVTATDVDGNEAVVSAGYEVLAGSVGPTQVSAGGTLTTDPGDLGPSIAVPIQTSVLVPEDATISITSSPTATPEPAGFDFLSREVTVAGPDAASASTPYVISLMLDASLSPDPSVLRIARNGSLVSPCTGPVGPASPDPCSRIASAADPVTGDLTVTVYATQLGTWSFAVHEPYAFKGFITPVDNPPTFNTASAGSKIPLKFSLGGDQGLDVLAIGTPASAKTRCNSAPPRDAIESFVTGTGLRYNTSTNQYVLPWKTKAAWAGTCRLLTLRLADGSEHRAKFEFGPAA